MAGTTFTFERSSRRRVLAGIATGLSAVLAGCLVDAADQNDAEDDDGENTDSTDDEDTDSTDGDCGCPD